MKILQERLLLNNLEETLNLIEDDEICLIQRNDKKDAILISLDKYNEINAEIYRLKNKKENI